MIEKNEHDCEFKGQYFISQESEVITDDEAYYGGTNIYLHKNGVWRNSTKDKNTQEYSGYYNSFEEAQDSLNKFLKQDSK